MRPLRLLATLFSAAVFITCLYYISASSDTDRYQDPNGSGDSGGLPYPFRNPGSIFTPTATISLTDDNSTFFAARPAAFGPLLPSPGLSGQIWVGSGFGDDSLRWRGIAAGMEGELGCSDIPGWTAYEWQGHSVGSEQQGSIEMQQSKSSTSSSAKARRSKSPTQVVAENGAPQHHPAADDGTDDHLHFPLRRTPIFRRGARNKNKSKGSPLGHADIQSLQESAEIAGKVVLLSRGGCGFAEKVKWAQRRGAFAVIVGDNLPGGPLVRMYAHGDTSNITIPSLFTSHTTAHLLSSLIPAGLEADGSTSRSWRWPSVSESKTSQAHRKSATADQRSVVSVSSKHRPTSNAQPVRSTSDAPVKAGNVQAADTKAGRRRTSLSTDGVSDPLDSDVIHKSTTWLRVEDFDEDEALKAKHPSKKRGSPQLTDDFVIGIQDWRDPDVVGDGEGVGNDAPSFPSSTKAGRKSIGKANVLSGGSITPGSGEYEPLSTTTRSTPEDYTRDVEADEKGDRTDGWLKGLTWRASDAEDSATAKSSVIRSNKQPSLAAAVGSLRRGGQETEFHEGLWVTLMPTDMNASPFLNTLFVLVVSPLVTLAIVYSMLLLRSRIRRRRWRAPKSVVERLPVRTFHTISRTNSASSDAATPPPSSTTPLLADSRATDIARRPRSRTVSGAGMSSPSTTRYGSSGFSEQEKVNSGLAEWRRKNGGKQVECVDCLEEYVDGVSKVMSLPCGHEFHADCITPWLTTRRRTCPICKGDVVRSMAGNVVRSGTRDLSQQRLPNVTSEEDVQAQAGETISDSATADLPVPLEHGMTDDDLESQNPGNDDGGMEPDVHAPSWISRHVRRGLEYIGVLREQRPRPQLAIDRNR